MVAISLASSFCQLASASAETLSISVPSSQGGMGLNRAPWSWRASAVRLPAAPWARQDGGLHSHGQISAYRHESPWWAVGDTKTPTPGLQQIESDGNLKWVNTGWSEKDSAFVTAAAVCFKGICPQTVTSYWKPAVPSIDTWVNNNSSYFSLK